jgi:hypothetical protein
MRIMPYKVFPFTLAIRINIEPVDSFVPKMAPRRIRHCTCGQSPPAVPGPNGHRDPALLNFEP